MNKKVNLFTLAFVALASIATVASANMNYNQPNNKYHKKTAQSTVRKVTINGTIVSKGSNSFVIRVGNRDITVMSTNATFMRENRTGINFSDLQVGDRVSVTGTTTQTTKGFVTSISATVIRDMTR